MHRFGATDARKTGPHRLPLWGDMAALRVRHLVRLGADLPDVLCAGTPCQDFSIAGLRAGLDGARGDLTLSFIRLANAIDNARRARGLPALIIFWENVPGIFSHPSNPFGNVLAAMVGEDTAIDPVRGKWTYSGLAIGPRRSAAWRTLDTQYFGLPQRRERVFIVASARDGFDPAAVLFEPEGVRRYSPPSRETGASGGSSRDYIATSSVRRLTPTECERLQGVPDGHTRIPYRNGIMSDGPRYKMLGNGWSINVIHWLGRRIEGELQSQQVAA